MNSLGYALEISVGLADGVSVDLTEFDEQPTNTTVITAIISAAILRILTPSKSIQIDSVRPIQPQRSSREQVPELALVARESDPYRNVSLAALDGRRAREVVELPGEGHINIDDGHGPFPPALEWVLNGVWPQ